MTPALRCTRAQAMYRRHRRRKQIEAVGLWLYRGLALLGVAFIASLTCGWLP